MAYKIALVDASPSDDAEFRRLLGQVLPRLDRRWEPSAFADADLVVVDIDSVFGHMTWLRVHGAGKRAAAFTKLPDPKESDLILRKPLNADGLAALLTRYAADESAPMIPPASLPPVRATVSAPNTVATPEALAPVATRPGVTTPRPSTTTPLSPEPVPVPRDLNLIDFLTGSMLTGPVRLVSAGAPELVLDPKNQQFHVASTSLRSLAPYCTRVLKVTDWQALGPPEFDKSRNAAPGQPYARLLWFCTLMLSEGRLLPELDANARYKLARWPQIEREFPKHFRIATVMMKQLATLPEIAEGAGSSQADVVDFINAYHTIGFVENDIAKPTEPVDPSRGGVLSRLRNPFGRGST